MFLVAGAGLRLQRVIAGVVGGGQLLHTAPLITSIFPPHIHYARMYYAPLPPARAPLAQGDDERKRWSRRRSDHCWTRERDRRHATICSFHITQNQYQKTKSSHTLFRVFTGPRVMRRVQWPTPTQHGRNTSEL